MKDVPFYRLSNFMFDTQKQTLTFEQKADLEVVVVNDLTDKSITAISPFLAFLSTG